MFITVICSVMMMASLFLMIFAAVAFIQDKRMFTSAPKDIQVVIRPRPERFPFAHALGYLLLAVAILLFLFALFAAGYEGNIRHFSYGQLVVRYLVMFYLLKIFDVLFLDFFVLCHSHFYQHYFPETEGCQGFSSFGFNWKSHLIHCLLFIPLSFLFSAFWMFIR